MKKLCVCFAFLSLLCVVTLATEPAIGQSLATGFAVENGDTNGDLDRDLSDGIYLLSHLFLGSPAPVPLVLCASDLRGVENGDVNGDGTLDLSDAVYLFGWLYGGGPEPTLACGDSDDGSGGHFLQCPLAVPPRARPFGKSYAEWSSAWWRWALSIPAATNPIFDATGASCGLGQSGPVWFLAGTAGGEATRSCTIPLGKLIFFSAVNFINDYPCPDPSFQPAPGQSLEDFLTEGLAFFIDRVAELEVELDGCALRDPFRFRATSDLFTFTGDPSLTAVFDPCITGTPQQAVSDGYWFMLAPLLPGEHTLHVRGKIVFDDGSSFESNVTNHLTIALPHGHGH
jgi:hypothetical protein